MPRRGPLRDDRCAAAACAVGQVEAVHREVCTREERPDGCAQQQGTCDAVDRQEDIERLFAENVACLAAELVGDGLYDETQQNGHPHIVGAAERGGVEERERGEERAAERHERREGELPFAAQRIDQHVAFLLGPAEAVKQSLSALHEEQEDQQRSQQGDDQPPIMLQECYSFHSSLFFFLFGTDFNLTEQNAQFGDQQRPQTIMMKNDIRAIRQIKRMTWAIPPAPIRLLTKELVVVDSA